MGRETREIDRERKSVKRKWRKGEREIERERERERQGGGDVEANLIKNLCLRPSYITRT